MAELETDVTVRRRGRLMAVVAAVSAGLAAVYLWRFATTGSPTGLVVGAGLCLIALCHGFAWTDARTPLLVADATGLRIRLGSAWTGVPWELVDHVGVEGRGWVRDGQVSVVAVDSADVLGGASRRSRWAAWLNRWLYDASLVVPYGLTTIVSVPDVAGSLEKLAHGRAPIVILDGPEAEPKTTVDVSPVEAVEAVEAVDEPAARQSLPSPPPADVAPDPSHEAAPGPTPKRKRWVLREHGRLPGPGSPVVPHTSSPARREEVTIALRSERATLGALALADSAGAATNLLPEIEQLRRSADPRSPETAGHQGAAEAGNVTLVIDATSDLSERAMRRVRSPGVPRSGDGPSVQQAPRGVDVPMPGTVIGGQVTEARTTLGLTVDELAERTRIRPYVIESIEVDDFSPCGGDFYAKGHLRMLARVLGIDAAPLVEAYDDRFATSPVNAREVFEIELATGSTGLVRGGKSGANLGALIAAVLILLLVWGVARYLTANTGLTPTDAVSRHQSSGPAASAPGSPGPADAPTQTAARRAQVKLTASGGDSRVVVRDGVKHVVFTGMLVDGTAKKVNGEAPLRVHAADAGVIRLSIRGKLLGSIGAAGVPGHRFVRASGAR